ncbi:hypothetical protein O7626_40365 [Micromonospora sp. WMMD1102]|uniref:hypothetical protein n=1 Tax=Micromonospora sp. WMMD1102 TaxID=3016105 RepID=UPI0024155C53|nr:hypothetical protein [Micromonospora sp. WMMD1102]MDG4792073.1 hypothetical protein [Micromonospora sp. WMMD1102]
MTDTLLDDDEQVDPYEDIDPFNYYAWLGVAPPAEFGPAIHNILDQIKRRSVADQEQLNNHYRDAYNADPDRHQDAADRAEEAYEEHPIGSSSSCAGITDIDPWVEAVRMRIGLGPSEVLMAVALRDHKAITEDDFATLTGWWTAAGRTLPEPISDDGRAALVAWWKSEGV